jgi:hypothetical protein
MKTSTRVILYMILYGMAFSSILVSVEGLRFAADLPCANCPNGKNGENGEPGFCTDCCPGPLMEGFTINTMYWTMDSSLNNNITSQGGWGFKNIRSFLNGGQTDSTSPGLFNIPFTAGLWQLTYEVSLQVGTTTILYKNYTGGNNTEVNSLCGSTTTQAWISGISVQNMSDVTQNYLFTTASSVARAAFPGPSSGVPLIRLTATQYATY